MPPSSARPPQGTTGRKDFLATMAKTISYCEGRTIKELANVLVSLDLPPISGRR
jgi:hypothetical protein